MGVNGTAGLLVLLVHVIKGGAHRCKREEYDIRSRDQEEKPKAHMKG